MNKPQPDNSSLKKNPISHLFQDDEWIRSHFQWLIDHYPGQYVIVARGEAFIGEDVAELERQAKTKYPRTITTGMPIPKPEDFSSILHVYP